MTYALQLFGTGAYIGALVLLLLGYIWFLHWSFNNSDSEVSQ